MTRTESPSVSIPRRSVLAYEGRADEGTVVGHVGEYDVSSVGWLWDTLAGAMACDGADLVIDLSGVEFIDAATVGVMVRAGNYLRGRSRSLVLRGPSRGTRRVLDLCRLAGSVEGGAAE